MFTVCGGKKEGESSECFFGGETDWSGSVTLPMVISCVGIDS